MSDFTFDGFEPANTTPVPDVLFDLLLTELNESELKVLLYIIRRTAGFKKATDAISLTQFQKGIRKRATGEILDKGCGVKDRGTIVKALASLEKKGCIETTKAHDPQGDKATSSYRIKFRSRVVGKTNHPTDIGSGQNQPPWFAKPTTGSGQNQLGVVGDSNPQETVIQLHSKQETVRQESAYSDAPGSDDQQDADASQTHTLSVQDEVVEEPYQPDFNLSAKPTLPEIVQMSPVVDAMIEEVESRIVKPTISPSQDIVIPAEVVPAPQGYTQASTKAELSTRRASSPQQSAKVAPAQDKPKQHKLVTPSLFGSSTPARPQLTEKGEEVRQWYATIRAMNVRKTKENVDACNGLAECDGMSFENLKAAIEHWEADKYVKDHEIVVDLQKLEKSGGIVSFEKAMVAIRNKQKTEEARTERKNKGQQTGVSGLKRWVSPQAQMQLGG